MNNLKHSLKYIIELTEAYKNDFITKDEYKELRANELIISALIIRNESTKTKSFLDVVLMGLMFSEHIRHMQYILIQPKPRFESGGVLQIAGTPQGKEIITDPKGNTIN